MQEREFTKVTNADFENNYIRAIVDCDLDTQNAYINRIMGWCGKLPNHDLFQKLKNRLDKIELKRQSGELKDNSYRQYKAAAAFVLSSIPHATENKFLNQLKSHLNKEQAYELYVQVLTWQYQENRLLENNAHSKAKTSASKAKYFPKEILALINEQTDDKYLRLQYFVNANIILGLRPCEWFEAILLRGQQEIENDVDYQNNLKSIVGSKRLSFAGKDVRGFQGAIVLKVTNAKNSHNRACGTHRFLVLDDLSDTQKQVIARQLLYVKQFKEVFNIKTQKQFNQKYTAATQAQFHIFLYGNSEDKQKNETVIKAQKILLNDYRRAKRAYNINRRAHEKKYSTPFLHKPPIKLQPTMYSTRHQAVANAKNAGINPVLIAALFGHNSVKTAEYHYGKAFRSYSKSMVKPHFTNVQMVINQLSQSQLDKVLKHLDKTEYERLIKPPKTVKPMVPTVSEPTVVPINTPIVSPNKPKPFKPN